MKHLLLLLTLISCTILGHAQPQGFRIGIGLQRTHLADRQASPLNYKSAQKTFLMGYHRLSTQSSFDVQLQGALGAFLPGGHEARQWYNPGYNADGTPKSDSGRLVGKMYHANFRVGYSRKISEGHTVVGKQESRGSNYVGASLGNQTFYSDHIVRAGWLNATSLNADLAHRSAINTKHNFFVKLTIPLVARTTRLPYHNTVSAPTGDAPAKTLFKQGSRFAWLGTFQNVQLEAGYDYAVARRLGVGLRYAAQWLQYSREKPVTFFQNNISILASVK